MESGGFLVPQEFIVDLAFVFGREILLRQDPGFTLPRLVEYEKLQREIGRLPHFLHRHFPGHNAYNAYDSFMWPRRLPFVLHPFLYRVSLLVSRLLFGGLQRRWREVRGRQHRLEHETVRKALQDLGYPVDDLAQMFKSYQMIERGN